jgi:hypothetical protein
MARLHQDLSASLHDKWSRESMFVSVGRDGKLTLCEPDDFKRLHIEAADRDMPPSNVTDALASVATRDDNNFWVGVEALQALSGRAGDAAWARNFAAMIASVQKFGWLSADGQRVRCHLKSK